VSGKAILSGGNGGKPFGGRGSTVCRGKHANIVRRCYLKANKVRKVKKQG